MKTFLPLPIQTKLTIGQPGDKYELEADAMADQVMRMPQAENPIQRQCKDCEEESLQMKPIDNNNKPIVQRSAASEKGIMQMKTPAGPSSVSNNLGSQLQGTKGGGTNLSDATNQMMSTAFGTDFSGVRVHTDSNAIQMNRSLGARAFTNGTDVYFNKGEYNPASNRGKHLLAHELTHVVQQGSSGQMIQRKCDPDSAINFYTNTNTGQQTVWTPGLVEELFKVVGIPNKALYENAKTSGVIDENFVLLVCQAQRILGLAGDDVDGKIGPTTIATWEKWKTGGEKGIDYNKLFADKKLEIGVAVGYEFHDSEFIPIEALLLQEGLTLDSSSTKKKTYKGKKSYKIQGDNTAPPVEIEIIVDCISQKSSGAKDTFGEFLTQKEITIYSGHARYGTGPDFDDDKGVAQNFVIGVNSALHAAGKADVGYNKKKNDLLKGRANDLEALSKAGKFDPDLYQVWFMNACSSINYLDEIRNGLVTDQAGNTKSKEKLRFMGTDELIVSDALNILKGVLKMQTMEEIITVMNQTETTATGDKKSYYLSD